MLVARVYAGTVSQLVRPEPPAPVQPVRSGPGPMSLMAKRAGKTLKRLRRRKKQKHNGERKPFRPHCWFGKRRRKTVKDGQSHGHKGSMAVVAVVAVAASVATVPQSALADGHEPWRDEIDFELTEPVEGRRIYVEGLAVSGDRAAVTLRAATDIELRTRAYGGPEGSALRFWGSASLSEGLRWSGLVQGSLWPRFILKKAVLRDSQGGQGRWTCSGSPLGPCCRTVGSQGGQGRWSGPC